MYKNTWTVLVVEDNLVTQESLREMFELAFRGLTTQPNLYLAGSGEEGLDILKRGTLPDVLVLDLQLPGMSGAEMLDLLTDHQEWSQIPVFPYSSLWDETIDQPMNRHLQIVQDWLAAQERRTESGGWVSPVVPKPQSKQPHCRVHPKLLLFIAGVLVQQGHALSHEFQRILVENADRIGGM